MTTVTGLCRFEPRFAGRQLTLQHGCPAANDTDIEYVFNMSEDRLRYRAFISYSHRDKTWGDWLHRSLETFRVPRQLADRTEDSNSMPARVYPVFRDREELPTSSDLGTTINDALAQSESLIVICSPNSAQSRWVNEEILSFKRLGRGDRIFCLIVDGEPNASDDPARTTEECFPEALRYALGDDGELGDVRTEPIAADARKHKDGKRDSLLKVTAGVLGVGFDDLKRRDLQRQIRRWTWLSTGAICLLAVTTTLAVVAYQARNEAVRQEQMAQANYRKARSAVDRFFIEVSDNELFETHGLQKLRERLLRDGLEYYQGFLKDRENDPDLLLETALTHVRIGEMTSQIGDRNSALESYAKAEVILGKLIEEQPASFDLRLHRAELQDSVSVTLWSMGRRDKALERLTTAQRDLAQLVREDPSNADAQLAWKQALRNLGPFQRYAGRIEEARKTYEETWEAAQNGAGGTAGDSHPIETDLLAATAAMNLGVLYQENDGDLDAAKVWFNRAEKVAEAYLRYHQLEANLNDDRTEVTTVQELLSSIYTYLGANHSYTGNSAQARDATQRGLTVATMLAERNPDVTSYQEQVANLSSNLASLHGSDDDPEQTADLHKTAVATLQRLTVLHPDNLQYRFQLAQSHNNLGIHWVNLEQWQKAVDEYDEAVAQLRQIHEAVGENPVVMHQLINTQRNLGWALFSSGDAGRAQSAYETAGELLGALLESESGMSRADSLATLASIHLRLASIARQSEEPVHADEQSNRAAEYRKDEISTLESLRKDAPDGSAVTRRLVQALNLFGQELLALDRAEQAETAFDQAGRLYDLTRPPDEFEAPDRELIAHTCGNLGWIHLRHQSWDDSIQMSQSALQFDGDLAWVKMNLGNAYLCSGQYDKALSVFRELQSEADDHDTFIRTLEDEFKTLGELSITHPDMSRLRSDLFQQNSP